MWQGFWGEYEYRVDDKGRIPLPPQFRERFWREGGFLAAGLDGCLRLYPFSEWEQRVQKYEALPDARHKTRRLLRFNYGSAFPLELDRQGRVALPLFLRQHADIQEGAVVVGLNRFLEVWSPRRWQEEKAAAMQAAWQNSESLESPP